MFVVGILAGLIAEPRLTIRSSAPAAAPADMALRRKSRTRSSDPLSAEAACRNLCSRKRTDRHQSAWSRWP